MEVDFLALLDGGVVVVVAAAVVVVVVAALFESSSSLRKSKSASIKLPANLHCNVLKRFR